MTVGIFEIEFVDEGHGAAAITLAVDGRRTVLSPVTYLTILWEIWSEPLSVL